MPDIEWPSVRLWNTCLHTGKSRWVEEHKWSDIHKVSNILPRPFNHVFYSGAAAKAGSVHTVREGPGYTQNSTISCTSWTHSQWNVYWSPGVNNNIAQPWPHQNAHNDVSHRPRNSFPVRVDTITHLSLTHCLSTRTEMTVIPPTSSSSLTDGPGFGGQSKGTTEDKGHTREGHAPPQFLRHCPRPRPSCSPPMLYFRENSQFIVTKFSILHASLFIFHAGWIIAPISVVEWASCLRLSSRSHRQRPPIRARGGDGWAPGHCTSTVTVLYMKYEKMFENSCCRDAKLWIQFALP